MTDAGFGRFVDEETLQYERIFRTRSSVSGAR